MASKQDFDNVLTPDFRNSSLDIKEAPRKCKHTNIVVDPASRQVECKICGQIVDPIDVLMQFATDERRLRYSRDEVMKVQRHIKALKTEESRLRSRIREVKAKLVNEGSGIRGMG